MTGSSIPQPLLRDAVARALAEDFGGRGDVTGRAVVPETLPGRFEIRCRSAGVLAGVAAATETAAQVDPRLVLEWRREEGDRLASGDVVAVLSGPARAILAAERTMLNFLGRLSGIATLTRAFVDTVDGTGAAIAHTRKTTPGLRALELEAVRAGGGQAHRFGLDDAVLIKDNHVALAGGVGEAVRRARGTVGHMTRVAVEIDGPDQLDEALEAGAESVLLDNFDLDDLREAVRRCRERGVTSEASGGVTLDTVADIAATGVDVISVGALTHSAPNLDLGLDSTTGKIPG